MKGALGSFQAFDLDADRKVAILLVVGRYSGDREERPLRATLAEGSGRLGEWAE